VVSFTCRALACYLCCCCCFTSRPLDHQTSTNTIGAPTLALVARQSAVGGLTGRTVRAATDVQRSMTGMRNIWWLVLSHPAVMLRSAERYATWTCPSAWQCSFIRAQLRYKGHPSSDSGVRVLLSDCQSRPPHTARIASRHTDRERTHLGPLQHFALPEIGCPPSFLSCSRVAEDQSLAIDGSL
jgi:hypothetical protein